MATVMKQPCPACGRSIAVGAAACPDCGKVFTTTTTKVILVGIILVVGLMILAGIVASIRG